MSAISMLKRLPSRPRAQTGATAPEFGLIVLVFLIFVFGIIELARLLYAFNTLQETTRQAASAASTSAFGKAGDMDALRQNAVFRSSAGQLALMPEITDRSIRIDYLWMQRSSDGSFALLTVDNASLATSPVENAANCLADPYSDHCVQFVRARICDPSDTAGCTPVAFHALTSLIPIEMPLPTALTIVRAQSLGAVPR